MWKLGLCAMALVACACPSQQSGGPAVVTAIGGSATSCEAVREKVAGLYRAEAQVREPKRVEDAVADNTAMVLSDCAKSPAKVAACIGAASTVAALEKTCLVPLDPEGTEGDALGGHK